MRIFITLLGLMGLGVTFQNCAPALKVTEEASLSINEYRKLFNYPYDKTPTFYGEVQLVSNTASAKFNDIAYVGMVGHAEGASKNYTYELKVTNENDFPVCPTMTGQLMSGQTSVMGNCISNVTSTKVKIMFKVTVDGATQTFQKIY